MALDADRLRSRLGSSDYRRILKRCGFHLDETSGLKPSGVLGPKELDEGKEGNFSVDLEQGLVKDWGSSRYKGDVFSVVQDVHGLSFPEALEWILDELNLDSSTLERKPNGKPDNAAHGDDTDASQPDCSPESVVPYDKVNRWHERLMSEDEAAQAARSYLTDERGITGQVLRATRIGLAHSPADRRAEWWIMIPVPDREAGDDPPIAAVKGFGFDPSQGDWKRGNNGRKIPRNAGSAALYDLVPPDPMEGPVLVCEGELDALSALSHGFNAVTGTAGAGTFNSEWSSYIASLAPAQEWGVRIAFDGDETGREGARDAARKLHEAGTEVHIAPLPDKKDVNDVLTEDDRTGLHAYLAQAEPYEPPKADTAVKVDENEPELQYEPFPIGTLPGPVRSYVRASTRALGEEVPPAMVAVPTLSVLSGAIGDAVRLELKSSWPEIATLWTVLVAPSGSTKSPAFSHAVHPIFRRESEARDEHEQALAEWNAQKDPDPQDKPGRKRYRTGDATPEAVVKILEENPRGVLLARDELAAWIGSFDRYVNGSADLQFWAEVWGGKQASRDRVGEGNTTIDTPAVPVTGTIQPGTLKEKLGAIHFDTGFAARLILCQPPTPPKRWTEADVSREVRDEYEHVLSRLYGLPRGSTVSISHEAKSLWVEYYNEANAKLETRPDGPARAVASKGITHTARLVLVLHLCRKASGETDSNEVDTASMEAALQVGQWLTEETLRVYRMHNLGAKAKPPIRRFLERLPERFETSEAKEIAEANSIPERTCEKWLRDLTDSFDLEKVKRGLYRKP